MFGGQLLPPAQTLVATIIFALGAKMLIESTIPYGKQNLPIREIATPVCTLVRNDK